MRVELSDQANESGLPQQLNPVSELLAITPAMELLMLATGSAG